MADFLVDENGWTWLSRLDDGRVMCCICFAYRTREELADSDEPGIKIDVCDTEECKSQAGLI